MKKLMAAFAVALSALVLAGAANATTVSTTYSWENGNKECTLSLEYPYLHYYAPWQQWSVRSNVYASCRVRYGNDWLPFDAEAIDVYAGLWREEATGDVLADSDESHVTDVSLTSIWLSKSCSYEGNAYYYVGASAYFDLGFASGPVYTGIISTPRLTTLLECVT